MSDGTGIMVCVAATVSALVLYALSCDLRRWAARKREAFRLRKLRRVYEAMDEEALEWRAATGVAKFLGLLADSGLGEQWLEILTLPETDEPRIAL